MVMRLVHGLDGVVVALQVVLLGQVAVDGEQVGDLLRGVGGDLRRRLVAVEVARRPARRRPARCGRRRRPGPTREMIVGCGTPASSQTLLMRKTTSLAYSCSV